MNETLTAWGIASALSAWQPLTPRQFAQSLAADGWPLDGRPVSEWEWWET